jgi:hypothetical protein
MIENFEEVNENFLKRSNFKNKKNELEDKEKE